MPRKAGAEDYAETYFAAAQEYVTLSIELYRTSRYVMAHYLSGLAVECLLRAYRYRVDPEFSARHNLRALYDEAGFDDIIEAADKERAAAALAEVSRRWSNNHRFRSERSLREYLRRVGLGGTGKFVRESSRRITAAAAVLVEQGVSKWSD